MDIKYTECTITTTLHEAAADLQKKLLKVQSYPLHNALRNNNKNLKEIKQLVMENSHNINLKDSKGKTPLHYAYKSDQNIKLFSRMAQIRTKKIGMAKLFFICTAVERTNLVTKQTL